MSDAHQSGRPIRVTLLEDDDAFTRGFEAVCGDFDIELVASHRDAGTYPVLVSRYSPGVAVFDLAVGPIVGPRGHRSNEERAEEGLQALLRVRQQNPNVRCVVATAHHYPNILRQALDAGVHGLCFKSNEEVQAGARLNVYEVIQRVATAGPGSSPYIDPYLKPFLEGERGRVAVSPEAQKERIAGPDGTLVIDYARAVAEWHENREGHPPVAVSLTDPQRKILRALAARSGGWMSAADLAKEVRSAGENPVQQQISRIRAKLEKAGIPVDPIETSPRLGYRTSLR